MARARNLKPGFFKNEDLAELGPFAMLLFEGLWVLADKQGRLEDRPKRIKAETFPYFDQDVDALLNQLQGAGFIQRYEAAGQRYIQVTNFYKHQAPHIKEAESIIPAPCESGACTVPESLIPDSLSSDSLIPDSGLLESADEPRKAKRATSMMPDWVPDENVLSWVSEQAFTQSDLDREIPKFRNHFLGNGKTMKDWSATFRNWMLRSREWGSARASPPASKTVWDAAIATARAKDAADESRRNGQGSDDDLPALLAHRRSGAPGREPDGGNLGDDTGGRAIEAPHRIRAD